jgi:outer membrane protein assembly factor BamB
VAFLALTVGSLALKEYFNSTAYNAAVQSASAKLAAAVLDEQEQRYGDAITRYQEAKGKYGPVLSVFSPVMNFNQRAKKELADLDDRIGQATEKKLALQQNNERKSKQDFEAAEAAMKALSLYEALELYEQVASNTYTAPELAEKSKASIENAKQLIAKVEEGRKRLAQNPNQAFTSLEEEVSYKRAILQQFGRNPRLIDADDMQLPLWIKPDTDFVTVFLNGALKGSVSQNTARDLNTFRYPITGNHRFEFKKEGYKTVSVNTLELQQPVFQLNMQRQPTLSIDLKSAIGDGSLAGQAVLYNDSILVGTSEGSLLEVDISTRRVTRRYDLPGGGGVNKEVLGQIFVYRRDGKPDIIVYATRAGDCVGVTPVEAGFKVAWPPIKGSTMQALTAAPAVGRLPLLSKAPLMMIPVDKTLRMVDCERGLEATPIEWRSSITASPLAIEQNSMVIVGCEDGNYYGLSTDGELLREYTTNARIEPARSRALVYEDLLLGSVGGNMFTFEFKRSNFGTSIPLEGTVVMEPLALKKRVYIGSITREGFWCVDMVARRIQWARTDIPNMGGISRTPVVIDNQIYIVTDAGKIFAMDAEKGRTVWMYQVEGDKNLVCSPLVQGKRLFVLSRSGMILAFDEQPR